MSKVTKQYEQLEKARKNKDKLEQEQLNLKEQQEELTKKIKVERDQANKALETALEKFAASINALKAQRGQLNDKQDENAPANNLQEVIDKLEVLSKELKQELEKVKADLTGTKIINPSYAVIAEHFNELATKLAANEKIDISKFSQQLEIKLYGKPPMSPAVKAAILGVVGAVIGFTIGLIVGAVLTHYIGGVGGIPAAIVGAIKGWTVGTQVALGVAAFGGVGGIWEGAEKGMKNQKEYTWNKQSEEEALGGKHYEEIEGKKKDVNIDDKGKDPRFFKTEKPENSILKKIDDVHEVAQKVAPKLGKN